MAAARTRRRAGAARRRDSMLTHGVIQTTVRTPVARILPIRPSGSGNWCGLNSQVLYCVSQGESRTIASSGRSCSR